MKLMGKFIAVISFVSASLVFAGCTHTGEGMWGASNTCYKGSQPVYTKGGADTKYYK
jgi:hypothetical protein